MSFFVIEVHIILLRFNELLSKKHNIINKRPFIEYSNKTVLFLGFDFVRSFRKKGMNAIKVNNFFDNNIWK